MLFVHAGGGGSWLLAVPSRGQIPSPLPSRLSRWNPAHLGSHWPLDQWIIFVFFILLMILYFIFSYFIFQYVESSCWYVACLYSCICASSWMYPCSLLVSCSVQDSMEMRSTDTWTPGSLANAIVCALTFSIINNQLFLVLCFDVLMFCLFVLFFFFCVVHLFHIQPFAHNNVW